LFTLTSPLFILERSLRSVSGSGRDTEQDDYLKNLSVIALAWSYRVLLCPGSAASGDPDIKQQK
jgi:hypothetical protein